MECVEDGSMLVVVEMFCVLTFINEESPGDLVCVMREALLDWFVFLKCWMNFSWF